MIASADLPPAPPALVRPALAVGGARDLAGFGGYLEDQGATEGCGTTSLGMVLSYWRGAPGRLRRADLDPAVRRVDVGLTPGRVVAVARRRASRAAAAQGGSLEALRPWLAGGVPVILLIENGPRPGAGRFHFVVALALREAMAGGPAGLLVADPKGGRLRDMPAAELAWRWGPLRAGRVETGLDRAYVVVLPAASVPVRGADGVVRPSSAFGLPAAADFGWRVGLFEGYLMAANSWGPACERLGLRFWYW